MLPEKQAALPQNGYHLDTEWADAIDISVSQFRSNIRKYGIPHLVFGNATIVSAEDFYQHLRLIAPDSPGTVGDEADGKKEKTRK